MKREDVARELIINDIKGLLDTYNRCSHNTSCCFMLGGLLYYATVIDGAIEWCEKAKVDVKNFVANETISKLRAKIKLYSSDKYLSFAEQKELMDKIIEVEKKYWIDEQAKSEISCPLSWIDDMGLYLINGHYVGNTIDYAYEFSPFNPNGTAILPTLEEKSKTNNKPLIYNFAVDLGRTLQELHQHLQGVSCYVQHSSRDSFKIEVKNIRMDNYKFFEDEKSIYILNLCCKINHIIEFLVPLSRENRLFCFRMMYIVFYHLKFDLENLELCNVHYNMPFRNKYFRNAMAHYRLYGKLSDSEIKEDVIGFGLFEKYFSTSFDEVFKAVFDEFVKTRDSLESMICL